MRNVHIEKAKLKDIVAQNREKHLAEYKAGKAAFKVLVLEKLDDLRARVQTNDDFSATELVRLQAPASHEKDYDRVLRMLDLEEDAVITLDDEAFRNFVMDEWAWTEHFTATNKLYRDSVTTRR